MALRPARAADLPAQYEVFRSAIGELFHRHSFSPPNPPLEAFVAQQGHLLDHDAAHCFVAEEKGRVVAFSAAFARGKTWYLASLFVLPGFQGRGIGRSLLQRSWGDGYSRRITLTDSIQPVSNGLYGRAGLIPVTPLLHLAGAAARHVSASLEAAPPDADVLASLDLAAYGFPRDPDHELWRRTARATLWLRAGEPVAYSYSWPGGRVGPIAGLDGAAAAAALTGELASGTGERTVLVPGTSRELVEAALTAGLRFRGPPGLVLLSHGSEPPRSLALSGYSLF